MSILLDANLSPKRIGAVLTRRGHDVVSLASDAVLAALDDPQVLELAAGERRLLVTRNLVTSRRCFVHGLRPIATTLAAF